MEKEYFHVSVKKYSNQYDFKVTRPASLDRPKENAVIFIMEKYITKWKNLLVVKNCLIFWPDSVRIPDELKKLHVMVGCKNPRLEYCRFFNDNKIKNLPLNENFQFVNGAYISPNAQINKNVIIMPGACIGEEVEIGENVYIASGVKLMGKIIIGDSCIIRENAVLGADGLSTDRDVDGSAITMPQFGGVIIGNNVEIGANCVIGRGAIDNTVIEDGCKLDNLVFISHNVHLGKDTFIVGESIMFGSSSTGERAYISGNSTIRNKIKIGSDVLIGMGSVVTKDVPNGMVVMGNPASEKKQEIK